MTHPVESEDCRNEAQWQADLAAALEQQTPKITLVPVLPLANKANKRDDHEWMIEDVMERATK